MKKLLLISAVLSGLAAFPVAGPAQVKVRERAFEFGLGGALMNYTRTYVSDFHPQSDGSYLFDLKNKLVYGGADLSLAYGALDWMYFDVRGTVGMARYAEKGQDKQGFSLLAGPGIQLRPFTRSEWIQPFIRLGINYFTKNFTTTYFGTFAHDPTGKATWQAEDAWNKGRTEDLNQAMPVSFGAGVVGWMGNRVGLRLQAEYFMPFTKDGLRFAQGTAGLVFRFGGNDKYKTLADQYVPEHLSDYEGLFADRLPERVQFVEKRVEVPVEKTVEKIVEKIVEKEVKVEVPSGRTLAEMMDNVDFDFNKSTLTPASQEILNEVANILKQFPDTHFLVAGYTDARGGEDYNLKLSQHRAKAVYQALVERGVQPSMLLYRGFGKRMAMAPASASDEVRRGDRKVVMERITSQELWQYLHEMER